MVTRRHTKKVAYFNVYLILVASNYSTHDKPRNTELMKPILNSFLRYPDLVLLLFNCEPLRDNGSHKWRYFKRLRFIHIPCGSQVNGEYIPKRL
jgi:hypothetical protein